MAHKIIYKMLYCTTMYENSKKEEGIAFLFDQTEEDIAK